MKNMNLLLSLIILISIVNVNSLFPYPKNIVINQDSTEIIPKELIFNFFLQREGQKSNELLNLENNSPYLVTVQNYIKDRFTKNLQDLNVVNGKTIYVEVILSKLDKPSDYQLGYDTSVESYEILMSQPNIIEMQCLGYLSYLRAIETLFQLFEVKNNQLVLKGYPIKIADQPSYPYRGIMIDTARHYVPISDIKRMINGMQVVKLNVLHLHITDSESFPLILDSYPEIVAAGAFSSQETYDELSMLDLVSYASDRGITVIPEMDAPAHSRAWALSDDLTILNSCYGYSPADWENYCAEPPCGQLDPTLNLTEKVVSGVLVDIQKMFSSNYIHMGGDEINAGCWNYRPSIKQWMSAHNMSTYAELQSYFRLMEGKYLQSGKTKMFWFVNQDDIFLNQSDIVQYWGEYAQAASSLSNITNRIVLSPYDVLYLDCGTGGLFGGKSWCAPFKTWKDIYDFDPKIEGIDASRILGAEAPAWSEIINYQIIDQKIFPRASALAERLWNVDQTDTLKELVKRLGQLNTVLEQLGIKPQPVTSEYCQLNLDMCFFS